ncbi:MAG: arogenate dehydrogenase [Prochlorococcus sp. SP3034]|nr:arogenate dehydrogenase [Prochlorococcus sp. SP3034]|tara:strand:+ start:5235 stop:6074 length:840 start_codon:yes stop_codon:yes gene_type:complete
MNIGIVGLGLIGGSIGLRLQTLNHTVYGVVNNKYNQEKATERKLATHISTDLNILRECSVIFLALPIKYLIKPNKELIDAIPLKSIITDIASIKEPVINTWEKLHPLFIGSHPMAGTEHKGVNAGSNDLLENAKWLITTTPKTDINSVKILSELITSMKCKVITTTPENHDQATSLISHLPIFLASSLIETANSENNLIMDKLLQNIASSGFADTSRVGGGNSELGHDLAKYNSKNILSAINIFKTNLEAFEKAILEKDWELIFNRLEKSKYIRSKFLN